MRMAYGRRARHPARRRESHYRATRTSNGKRVFPLALVIFLFCAACAAPGVRPAGEGAAQPVSATVASSVMPAIDEPTTSRDVGNAVDPLAAAMISPVRRGPVAGSKIDAKSGAFTKSLPVVYDDGVVVSVRSLNAGTEKGRGVGALPGRAYAGFSVSVKNGTAFALDLNQVVVTTTYGSPRRIAAPVYEDPSAQDLSGILQPGQSASSAYYFAVPVEHRKNVSATVDFDSQHVPATFTGHLT